MARDGDRALPSGASLHSHTAHGLWFSWRSGRRVRVAADPDANNLHAGVGERCMICDRPIKRGQPVRRTISGGYAHDNC
jgi:hypothetical protein